MKFQTKYKKIIFVYLDEKVNEHVKSNSGGSDQSSSEESILNRSNQTNANTSTPLGTVTNTSTGQANVTSKSATIAAHTSTSSEKAKEKPKKKSKLSFLSRKKKDTSVNQ